MGYNTNMYTECVTTHVIAIFVACEVVMHEMMSLSLLSVRFQMAELNLSINRTYNNIKAVFQIHY